jgi:hypothetical protein
MIWMTKSIRSCTLPPLIAILLSTLACRPVITIGWQEIAIFIILLLFLLGPPLYRLYKRYQEYQSWKTKNGKDKRED